MPIEYIGYRNLYDALGCGMKEQEEFGVGFSVEGDLKAEIYFGPRPRFGVWVDKSNEKYLVPGRVGMMGEISYARDPVELDYPSSFFCEIACIKAVEVSNDLSQAFHRREKGVDDELLAMAEENRELKRTTALIAGVVGLRFHRQFVLELINEQPIAVLLDHDDEAVVRHHGRVIELLKEITLRQEGLVAISELLPLVGTASAEDLKRGANVFEWLLRAWSQRDVVNQFVDLFIPLEIILKGYSGQGQEEHKELAEAVENLIRLHENDDSRLLEYFNRLKGSWRPSLQTRFEMIAREAEKAGIANWEADVEAFRKFNRIRNDLLHRGEGSVELHVNVGQDETQGLEDLVERYVCFALFGNMDVYRRRHSSSSGEDEEGS